MDQPLDQQAQQGDGTGTPPLMSCLNCGARVPQDAAACPACGFPFSCDVSQAPPPRKRRLAWRSLLGVVAVLFLITSGVFSYSGYDVYQGYVFDIAARLAPDPDSGIPIDGPVIFVQRTQLALALLELRAPDFYWRMQDSISRITYLAPSYLETESGRRISLEGIGAMAEPSTGLVQVLSITAFPSGPDELWDRNIYSYAGVLVHELRHIELHTDGTAPGGWQEEWLCEKAAYTALKQMEAPAGLLLQYEMYLDDPQDERYQRWYRWYEQWQ